MKIRFAQKRPCLFPALSFLVLTIAQASYGQSVWNAVAGTAANTNWSTAANWNPNGQPGSSSNVIFSAIATAPNITTVNNVVDSSFGGTISSLIYSNITTGTFENTLIANGVTLNVTGSGGLVVGSPTIDPGASVTTTATISGAGGKLNLNNTSANMFVAWGDTTAATGPANLIMTNLDTFVANISRLQIGEVGINRASGLVRLAKTNAITANGTGTGTSAAIVVGDNSSNNGNSSTLFLGLTNAIFADNIGCGLRKQNGSSGIKFEPGFTNINPVAYFRGKDGVSPVANWILGDGNGASSTVTSTGFSDFSGGTVNAAVNVMLLARCSTSASGGRTANGTLTMSAGSFAANYVTNATLVTANNEATTGTIIVNGGVFAVNNNLIMAAMNGFTPGNPQGTLSVTNATAQANMITAGGGTSTINIINSTLAVTNNAGTLAVPLTTLALSNSVLDLTASATVTNVVVNTLNAVAGANNSINILSMPTIATYPAQFPLIKYTTGSGDLTTFVIGSLPASSPVFQGYISNNTTFSRIDLVITNGPIPPSPIKAVVWDGGVSGDWDTTSTNWTSGGILTNYNNVTLSGTGDTVTFDDTLLGATNVNLTQTLSPGSITVNNTQSNYVFSGTGKLSGTTGILKLGAGALTLTESGGDNFSGLVVAGGGSLVLSNTGVAMTGGISVTNGTLTLAHGGSIAGGLVLDTTAGGSPTATWMGSGTLSGGVTVNGGSALLDQTTVPTGNTTIGPSATLRVGNNDANGTLPSGTVTDNGTLIFNRSDTPTINNFISGSGRIIQSGTNMIKLTGSNSYTGGTIVTNGFLQVGLSNSLGTATLANVIVVTNGGTLDLGGNATGNALRLQESTIMVSGTGVTNGGAIINSYTNQQNALTNVTLVGDVTFGGPGNWHSGNLGRWDLRGNGTLPVLSTGGNPYKLTKVGSNQFTLVSAVVDSQMGDVDIQGGLFGYEAGTTGLGNPANNLFIRAGATLEFFQSTNALNKMITIFGDGVTTNLYFNSGGGGITNVITGPIILNGAADAMIGGGAPGTLSNVVSGSKGLIINASKVYLASNDTYTGNTTIKAGTLLLLGNGSISNSAAINVASGTVFDVSGASTTFTLQSGQILSNSSSTAVLNGSAATASGSTVSLLWASGTPSFTVTNGTLTLASGTVFNVNNTSAALARGSYKIISAAAAGNPGSVAGTLPSVTVGGNGLAHAVTPTLGITTGELYLVVPDAPPVIADIVTNSTTAGITWKIAISALTNAAGLSDPEGDAVSFNAVNSPSNLGNSVTSDSTYIYYNAPVTAEDFFTYTVTDGTLTTTGTVYLEPVAGAPAPATGNQVVFDGNGVPTVTFAGIPGRTNVTQASTNLTDWTPISTNVAGTNGLWQVIDTDATNYQNRFYRSYQPYP